MGKRKSNFIIAVAAAVISMYSGATLAGQVLKSKVTAVTVYPDRAMITRTAAVTLSPGTNVIEFGELPADFIEQSLRISGSAESKAKILDVRIKTVYTDTIPNSRIANLRNRLAVLRSREQVLVKKLDVLQTEMLFIDSLRVYYARTAGSPRSNTPYVDWQNALKFVEKNMDSVNARSLDVSGQLKYVREKINQAKDEIRRTQGYSRKMEKQVVVTMSSSGAARSELDLSYILPGARWSPVYEERVASGTKTIDIVYSGVVRQATGEDWNNVAITLSTSQPSAGGVPPSLTPWHVGVYETPRVTAGRTPKKLTDETLAKEALVKGQTQTIAAQTQLSKIASPVSVPVAEVREAATSATFVIAAPADIPGDNTPHKVTIETTSLPASLSYTCIPKLSDRTYLTAETKNTSDYPFLPGPANIFLDNSFVATSSVENVSPGQEFKSYLGTDKSIRVERKLINRFQESTGLLSKKTKVTYSFLITIENSKKVPIDLLVKDQVPVPTDERVAVEVQDPDSKEVKPDKEGFLQWHLNLKAGEKKELNMKFSLEYPSDLQVSGID